MREKIARLSVIMFALMLMVTVTACQKKQDKKRNQKLKTTVIEAREVLDFSQLSPKLDSGIFGTFVNNGVAMDSEENLYFVDMTNHRVMKYGIDGRFIKQIGQIGEGEEGFYYPFGLHVGKNKLYVLDKEGRELKVYDTGGNFISMMKFDNAFFSFSLATHDDDIYVNTVFYDKENYNSRPLISVFSETGEAAGGFGKIIQTQKFAGYVNFNSFNSVILETASGQLYGTFRNYPIIFCYDLKTHKELFYRDLRKDNIKEINYLHQSAIEKGLDTPGNIKTEQMGTHNIGYSDGFGVDDLENGYISINTFEIDPPSVILCVNGKGETVGRIYLKYKDELVYLYYNIFISDAGKRYVVGKLYKQKEYRLFQF